MKNLIRAAVVVSGVWALSGCALLNAAKSGRAPNAAELASAANEAKEAAQTIKDCQERAFTECKPLETKVVSWPEERAIGGAISIGFGQSGKGLFIDATEKDPKKLKAQVDKNKGLRETVKLSPSEKNDLNAYVQTVGEYVAAGSSRPGIAWTFGVIENDTPNAVSAPGGYVLVTTGLLALIDNEAQLAGVLGHEIGHVTAKHAIKTYTSGKVVSCKVALTGYYLVERGASNIPGAEEFVKNAKFGKTMKKFASPDGADMDNDPEVDRDFMVWFTNRIIDLQNLTGNAKEDEFAADQLAYEVMSAAGYDPQEFEKLIAKIPSGGGAFAHHPSNTDRIDALKKLRGEGGFGAEGGKAPALPGTVKWPAKPAA